MKNPKRYRISLADFRMTSEELQPVIDILRSGCLSEGQWVEVFETEWARHVGCNYCVTFSSGSTALFGGLLAAREVGLIRNGPILTNPSSYVGTVNAIVLAGFQVQFVDIESDAFGTLAVDEVDAALKPASASLEGLGTAVAAVLPVHLFGLPEDLPGINRIASVSRTPVIEDAAQAHGSAIQGRRLGSWGLFSIFSFYMSHTVPGIEMGAVVTNNERLYRQLRSVKDQGRPAVRREQRPDSFTAYSIGLNFKTNEISAAVALAHLKKLDQIIQTRRRNAQVLTELLAAWPDALRVPEFPDGTCPFAFPITIRSLGIGRDQLCALLRQRGIDTRPFFPCIPTQQPAYSALREEYAGRLPNSEKIGDSGFYVGCHEHMTSDDMHMIAESVAQILIKLKAI